MSDVFIIRSLIAGGAIFGGCVLIKIGSSVEVACVAGGIALLLYAFGVMMSLPRGE